MSCQIVGGKFSRAATTGRIRKPTMVAMQKDLMHIMEAKRKDVHRFMALPWVDVFQQFSQKGTSVLFSRFIDLP